MVSAEGVRAAARASMGGDAFVCVSFAACGAATPPLVSRAIDTLVYMRLPPEPSAELVPNLRTDAPLLPLSAGCLAPISSAAAALPPQRYPVPVLSGRANVLAF